VHRDSKTLRERERERERERDGRGSRWECESEKRKRGLTRRPARLRLPFASNLHQGLEAGIDVRSPRRGRCPPSTASTKGQTSLSIEIGATIIGGLTHGLI